MGFVNTITEGGQISIHSFRMLKQVLKIACYFAAIAWVLLLTWQMVQMPFVLYICFWYFSLAYFSQILSIETIHVDQKFWYQLTNQVIHEKIDIKHVIHYTTPYAIYLKNIFVVHLVRTGLIAGITIISVLLFFFIKGKFSSKKHLVSGNTITTARKLALKLRLTNKDSKIKVGPLPLIKNTETQHILVTGGTGSGKTNCFHHLLPLIRQQNQRAIIVDTTGVLVERYYNPETDTILNPLDPRSAMWNPWIECDDNLSYKALSESFISSNSKEDNQYWRTASQAVFSAVLQKLEITPEISKLIKILLKDPLADICEFVKDTPAAAHLDMSSEKTASSIRSVMSSFVECINYLKDVENPFSVRQWVKNEKQKGWLFLSCKPLHRAALNPLLTCWFSIAVRSLLELEPNFDRRIWFVIDEVPTLNRIKNLETLLTESRKYGGCGLLALQSPAQLEAIYGKDIAQIILGNCATKIVFTEQSPEIATKISQAFGEREIKEYQKSLTYGANDVRDGVNLNLQTKNIPLVTPTEIQFLKPNHAYVRLAGNYPIVKLHLKIAK